MAISIILICLALHRVVLFDRYAYQLYWYESYFRWIIPRIEKLTQAHTWMTILAIVIPIVILVSLLFTLVYYLLGIITYYVLSVILFWVCFDGRDLVKKPYSLATVSELFILTYQRMFAVIFWFVIFGPFGLMLYTVVISLYVFLAAEGNPLLLLTAAKLRGLFRLDSFAFAWFKLCLDGAFC